MPDTSRVSDAAAPHLSRAAAHGAGTSWCSKVKTRHPGESNSELGSTARRGGNEMNRESSSAGAALVNALRQRLGGTVLVPQDQQFDAGRRVWNAAIDRSPAAIIVCQDAEDVALALRVAAEHGIPVTVRGGGYNIAGRSVVDGAVLLDLSRMRQVCVNAEARMASVQGGARWSDVDIATAKSGLATTGGVISGTGVGGLTQGGGTGWLMRRYGLTLDNLLAAGAVLADGRSVRASPEDDADLFYALRGGGGGFGVVTSFEFRLHPVTQVLAGLVIRPASEARAALQIYAQYAAQAPEEFCGMAILTHAPPLPFLETSWHGRPVVIYAFCWSGDVAAGERSLEMLRRSGSPLAEHVGPLAYSKWQQMMDPAAPSGRYNYWKNTTYQALDDATIDLLAASAEDLPSRETEIHLQHLGGAIARVPEQETAFASRSARFYINLLGATTAADEFATMRDRVRRLYDRFAKPALPTRLPNFVSQDDGDLTLRMEGSQAARLTALRKRYDPGGVFALPSSAANR
jgi:FAD/FMN-containing dehydrogenase